MDLKFVFFVVVSISLSSAFPHQFHGSEGFAHNIDDYYDIEDRSLGTNLGEDNQPKYEVTENIIDTPNDNTPKVPIATNFTINRPLNLAKPQNNTNVPIVPGNNDKNNKIEEEIDFVHAAENGDKYKHYFNFDDIVPKAKDKVNGFIEGVRNFGQDVYNKLNGPTTEAYDYLNKIHNRLNNFLKSVNGIFKTNKYDLEDLDK